MIPLTQAKSTLSKIPTSNDALGDLDCMNTIPIPLHREEKPEKCKILIVDDEPQNIHILLEILKKDYAIVAAKNSAKALELAQKAPQPDLIVLDVMMPETDGYSLCKAMKSGAQTCHIPIMFISALDETLDKVKAFEVGGIDYITKPFQREEILARIATHLEIDRLRQKLYQQTLELSKKNEELTQINQDLHSQYRQIKATQLQLIQAEKMASLGQMMAGIAHEINNPTGFIKCNINPARDYIQTLFELIDFLLAECTDNSDRIQDELEAVDLDFIREDLPKLIDSMSLGVDRISSVSDSLRTFARDDRESQTAFNIHEGIDGTLLILKHRTKADRDRPEVEIIKHYGELPEIQCFPGQLSQVFMNILANALDAFDDANQGKTYAEIKENPNTIAIETSEVNGQIYIKIKDNGCGMKPEIVEHIFEQGFTTKGVGKGTGLGMAISWQIIAEKHGGTLTCFSQWGRGTEFTIALPLDK